MLFDMNEYWDAVTLFQTKHVDITIYHAVTFNTILHLFYKDTNTFNCRLHRLKIRVAIAYQVNIQDN